MPGPDTSIFAGLNNMVQMLQTNPEAAFARFDQLAQMGMRPPAFKDLDGFNAFVQQIAKQPRSGMPSSVANQVPQQMQPTTPQMSSPDAVNNFLMGR